MSDIGEHVFDCQPDTVILYRVQFKPFKFPPGVWYYKKQPDNGSGWVHHVYTRVYPWNDTYWWKARFNRTKWKVKKWATKIKTR